MVELAGKSSGAAKLNAFQIFTVILFFLAAFVVPTVFIVIAITASFRRNTRRQMLGVVLAAYFSCAVVFAGIYYSIQALSDENYARLEINHYKYEGMKLGAHLIDRVTPYKNHRAFSGIEDHFWTTIEDEIPDIATAYNDSPKRLMAIVGNHERSLPREPQNRLPVFLDCFHFSIMTITTVGYGDITPRERIAKLASDAEVLTGITLFVVALGMVFGNWWPEKPEPVGPTSVKDEVERIMAEALEDPKAM